MDQNENKNQFKAERHDRFWTGMALLVVGGVLFADKLGVYFPRWLFDWPSLLILAGLVTGIKCNFRNSSWLIMVGVGVIFLIDKISDDMNLKEFLWPILIIGAGLLFVMRPKKRWNRANRFRCNYDDAHKVTPVETEQEHVFSDDIIDSVSIFGGVKRVVTSKNFKGGEIVCFMGGAEYNLSQADIKGPITIEIMQVFGGTKLIVPPHWEIRSESMAIFAGVEDKRPVQPGSFDPNKMLILKGTTIFGGIEIKSY